MIKKHFTKELAMTKKDNQGFENYTNCCIVMMLILIAMLK